MSIILYQSSYTGTLTSESIEITEDDKVVAFTVLCQTGTCTILGSQSFQDKSPSLITLSAGQSFTKSATNYSFLKGYTITAVGGNTGIEITK